MKFLCEESCVDSGLCKSYRGSKDYELSLKEIERLKEIGHFKRFKPMDGEAVAYVGGEDPFDIYKPLKDLTMTEMRMKADELGINYPVDVTRTELQQFLKDSEKGKEPTVKELKAIAAEKGIEVPKKVTKAALIELIEAG